MVGTTSSSIKFFDKTFTYLNNEGETVAIKGIPRKTTIRQIYASQLKRVVRQGCKFFAVNITNEEHINKEDKLKLEDIPILRCYSDVFSEEILGLPRKRELDFTIELVPGVVPNSKDPYQMKKLEINKLKSQLK